MASIQTAAAALRLRDNHSTSVGPVQFNRGWRRSGCVKMKANNVNMRMTHTPLRDKGGEAEANGGYLLGGFLAEDRFVYRQTFVIRSYETGPDKTATMETLMNLLQVN